MACEYSYYDPEHEVYFHEVHIHLSRNNASPTPMPRKYANVHTLFQLWCCVSPHFREEENSQSYHNAKECSSRPQSQYQRQNHDEVKILMLETRLQGQNFPWSPYKVCTKHILPSKKGTSATILLHCKISPLKEWKINQTYRNDEYSSWSRLAVPWYLRNLNPQPVQRWSFSHSNLKRGARCKYLEICSLWPYFPLCMHMLGPNKVVFDGNIPLKALSYV